MAKATNRWAYIMADDDYVYVYANEPEIVTSECDSCGGEIKNVEGENVVWEGPSNEFQDVFGFLPKAGKIIPLSISR